MNSKTESRTWFKERLNSVNFFKFYCLKAVFNYYQQNTQKETFMDLNSILNQVLDVAKNSASKLETGNQTIDSITKVGGGAALGGILSMILGRSGGASLAKLGSLAVLGNLAYQAYQNYQKSQQSSQPNISENAFDVLNSSSHVDAGELILRTMIAAAAADGEITEDEKQTIANEAGNNPELAQWLEQEIQNPISINEIARLVGNDTALASNVYLAARLVSKDLSRKEIIFLADLAQALGLDDALVEQLEKQAGF